ncbi:FAR1-related sequence 5-like protein [Tanacetum coccineum]
MAVFNLNQLASSLSEEDDVAASNSHVVSVSSSINTGCDSFASYDNNASSSNSLKTPKAVIHHEFIDTPGGSVYWVPRVSASVLPVLGTVYDSLDECIEMYRKYASEAGFGIRLSCQKRLKCGYVKQKYIVCNREGCPKDVWLNTLDPNKNDRQVRSSNFRVCGCKARVVFDMVAHTSKYTLTTFDVEHNHELDRVEYKHLSKAERKLTYNEQLFIIKAANANIGVVRAHNLYTCLKAMLRCSLLGWNRGNSSQKTFLLTISLRMLSFVVYFLADEVAKCNYKEFGDIVQDGFCAFHDYRQLMEICYCCDRLAVAAEFPESKHRLCMWHIMQKIPAKIVSRIYDDTDFKDKFGKIVWNMFIGPEEFEDRWNKLMEEFNLVNHKWLSKMYRLRSSWVPSFFVDSPLCGLMRTTSRSESENSFFSYFTSYGSTLVKFMLCYESAMERQRHTQEKLDHQSFDSFPALLTPLHIEVHAANVYTRNLFIRVQKEIVAGSWYFITKEMVQFPAVDLIPPGLRNKKNHYGEKNEAIEKLAMEASIILDSCVHMLGNNEPKLSVFVNKMNAKNSDLEVELSIVPTRTVSDFVQEFMGVKKPDKVKVKNPTGVRPKGREKQKRIKSGREISMKKSMKKSNKKKNGCGVCGSTAHNRRTCPQNNDVDVLYHVVVVPGGSNHVVGWLRHGASGSVSV